MNICEKCVQGNHFQCDLTVVVDGIEEDCECEFCIELEADNDFDDEDDDRVG